MPEERKCLRCWETLTWRQTKFCSRSCKSLYNSYKEDAKICPSCWKEFVWRSYAKYCSKECAVKYKNSQNLWNKCLNCWIPILWTTAKKFCSISCKCYYNHHKVKTKICANCWTEFRWNEKTKYCCEECRLKWKRNSTERTSLEKYWTSHPKQSDTVKEKAIKSNLEKYWVEYSRQRDDVKEKILNINMERYWVPYHCMTKECRDASTTISKVNLWVEQFFISKWYNVLKEFAINRYSYDFKIWDTLIEINPYPFHNATRAPNVSWAKPKHPSYHYDKLKLARDNGYRCIMVRDWDDVEKITYLLDDNKETLYARNCELKQINYEDCHNFFEQYHLQWDTKKDKNNIYVWLYYNNELVECMSFGIPRYNKNYEWEILRLCSHKNYKIVWWANRIFKKFLEITKANSVISYCDMSKFDWKVYESLWFTLLKWNKPSKHWYNIWEEDSKKHITDNMLRQYGYDKLFNENFWKGTSNDELMKQRGYVEIFDCWQSTFVWQTELSYEIG